MGETELVLVFRIESMNYEYPTQEDVEFSGKDKSDTIDDERLKVFLVIILVCR
jgi:hypothetical protein